MRKFAILAAGAALFACPAFATDTVTSTIAAIDAKERAIVLADATVMLIEDSVDLAAIKVGMKVEVAAKIDEDGYARATSVTPIN